MTCRSSFCQASLASIRCNMLRVQRSAQAFGFGSALVSQKVHTCRSASVVAYRASRGRRSVSVMAGGYKYVILGGGNAAGYAAAEFVKRGGGKGELAIISREPYVAYERPTLSKAYLFPEGAPRLPGFHTSVGGGGEKQEPKWYEEKGIDFKVKTNVTSVDVKNKSLTTESGENITFEKLIVATGSRSVDLHKDFKSPGADLDGIYPFRDVQDVDTILAAIPDVKKRGGKVVIVGGGYIGMEVGSNLSKHGLDVTLVFPETHLMERLFIPEVATFYEEYYKDKGITLKNKSVATSFEGKDGKVTHAVLKDGTKLEAQLVVAGVGARPNTELLQGQIDLLEDKPGGIKVNGKLQSSHPDIYAIGDIAAYPLKRYGTTTRQEHVKNARQTGALAISHILDPSNTEDFNYLPFFYSRIFDLGWQLYGSNDADDTIFFGDTSQKKFGTYFVKDGKVVGAFLEGGSDEENKSLEKVAQQQPKAPSDLASQGLTFASKL